MLVWSLHHQFHLHFSASRHYRHWTNHRLHPVVLMVHHLGPVNLSEVQPQFAAFQCLVTPYENRSMSMRASKNQRRAHFGRLVQQHVRPVNVALGKGEQVPERIVLHVRLHGKVEDGVDTDPND